MQRYDSLKLVLAEELEDSPYKASRMSSVLPEVPSEVLHPHYRPLTYANPKLYDTGHFPDIFYDYGMSRMCKILICITIYNEDEDELKESLTAVAANVDSFHKVGVSNEQIAVFMIQDGIEKLSESLIAYGKSLGLFDRDLIQLQSEPNTLHFFEAVSPTQHVNITDEKFGQYPRLRIFTGIKEVNRGKLNSHLWFFSLVAQFLNPQYVVVRPTQLLDCGTVPRSDAIYYLIEEMELKKDVAGCCGELRVLKPTCLHFVAVAQDIEYRLSHILDKSTESCFGFVSVLPGAFSAYRWEQLNGEPLYSDYFYTLRPDAKSNCYKANMFLAEDRVLSVALVFRAHHKNILTYVSNSVAYTDVPRSFVSIIQQRRRWINGTWFAVLHTFGRLNQLKDSSHSVLWKCCVCNLMGYNFLMNLAAYLSPAIFYVFLHILSNKFLDDFYLHYLAVALQSLYGFVVLVNFTTALGNKPQSNPRLYFMSAWVMGLLTFGAIIIGIIELALGDLTLVLIFYAGFSLLCFLFTALVHGQFFWIVRGILQFIAMLPCYINIYLIYAFCNVHDVTWGLRNDKTNHHVVNTVDKAEEFRAFRTRFLTLWLLLNLFFIFFFIM
jgi:chitin synthase